MSKQQQYRRTTIERMILDPNPETRKFAMRVCRGRKDIPPEVIEVGLDDTDPFVRRAALEACFERSSLSVGMLERAILDADIIVSTMAINLVASCKVQSATIHRWISDFIHPALRCAAVIASIGQDFAQEILRKALGDPDSRVRAMAQLVTDGYSPPIAKTIA